MNKKEIIKRYEILEKEYFKKVKKGLEEIEDIYINKLSVEFLENGIRNIVADIRDLKTILRNMKKNGIGKGEIRLKEKLLFQISKVVGNSNFKKNVGKYLKELQKLKKELKPLT